jgi:hypothetical protein
VHLNIAGELGIPENYLSEVLARLAASGWIKRLRRLPAPWQKDQRKFLSQSRIDVNGIAARLLAGNSSEAAAAGVLLPGNLPFCASPPVFVRPHCCAPHGPS